MTNRSLSLISVAACGMLSLACAAAASDDRAPAQEQPSLAELILRTEQFVPSIDANAAALPRLTLLQNEEAPPQPVTSASSMDAFAIDPFGAKGSTRMDFFGGWAIDVTDDANQAYLAGGGLSYFIEQNLSLSWTLNGLYADQQGEDAIGVGFDLLLRWHVLTGEEWSIFADGGAGMLLTSQRVPDTGSEFNFTPQLGLGFTYDIGGNNRLMGGVRWHHVSNANLFDENPGRDHVFLYLGVSMPF